MPQVKLDVPVPLTPPHSFVWFVGQLQVEPAAQERLNNINHTLGKAAAARTKKGACRVSR